MAKADQKKKKKASAAGRGDAVRSAVDQAFQATAGQAETARVRAQDLVEELATAASRMRDALDDLRPAAGDEVRDLRTRVDALEKRIAALEKKPAARRSTTTRRKPTAKKAT